MRFPYYARLSRSDKAIYRASDEVTSVELPPTFAHAPLVAALEQALATDDRSSVERASSRLVAAMMRALSVDPVSVRVLAVRPRSSTEELHGLYERAEDEVPVISVWMRTARNERVVAFRTFLRTLMHEVCHHLDYELLALADSFHTEGFFRRESSLVRALAGDSPRGRKKPPKNDAAAATARAKKSEGRAKKREPKTAAASEKKPAKKPEPRTNEPRVRRDEPEQLTLF